MKAVAFRTSLIAMTEALAISLSACGKSNAVQGNTFEGSGGAFKIQFMDGGKASVALGTLVGDCTYVQKDKTITITCEGNPMDFTVNDDGSLSGPPNTDLGTLSRKAS